MYQRNLHQNNNNHNVNNNNNNRGGAAGGNGAGAGYNEDQYESSESDSDSDAEMEENPVGAEEEARAANALADANNILLAGAAENIGAVAEDLAAAINDLDDLEDPRPAHNGILERIDYIGGRRRENDLLRDVEQREEGDNLNAEESRPLGFDENSHENFGLRAIMDDDSACADAMRMVAPINDDSSRESMDIDSDTETGGVVELGNINIAAIPLPGEREPADAVGGVAGPSRFFGDTVGSYDSFLRIEKCPNPQMMGEASSSRQCQQEPNLFNGVLNQCCSSSTSASSLGINNRDNPINSHTTNNNLNNSRLSASSSKETSTPNVEHTCQKPTDVPSTSAAKPPLTTNSIPSHIRNSVNHCDRNNRPTCNADLDSSDDDEVEVAKPEIIITEDSPCDCHLAIQLDHVNGHSSKMSEEAASRKPCAKCRLAKEEADKVLMVADGEEIEPKANDDDIVQPAVAEEPEKEDGSVNEELAEPVAQQLNDNIRPRDPANDPEASRPNKKMKLNHGGAANRSKAPRTIFHKALDAVNMTWDNQHLKLILASNSYSSTSQATKPFSGPSTSKAVPSITITVNGSSKAAFNSMGQPLWHEPLAMCAARVDSLRSHGHNDAALRLSVSVVRTMKQVQIDAQLLWHRYQRFLASQAPPPEDKTITSRRCCCSCTQMPSQGMVPHKGTVSSSSIPRPLHDLPGSSKSYKMSRYDYDTPPTSSSRYNPMSSSSCRRCAESRSADRSFDYAHRPQHYPPVPNFHPSRFHHQNHPFAMRPQYMQSFDPRFSQHRYGYNNGHHHHHQSHPQPQQAIGPYSGNCTAPNCGTPSRPHIISTCGGGPPDGALRSRSCDECPPKEPDVPQLDAQIAGPSSAKDQPPPPPPNTFASSGLSSMINPMADPIKHPEKTPCTQHSKNQCCIKYFCCKLPVKDQVPPRCCPPVPPCAPPLPPFPPSNHNNGNHHHHGPPQHHNVTHFNNPTQCHIKSYERMPNNFQMYEAPVKREQCPCLIANGSVKPSSGKSNNVVNYGASTSKSSGSHSSTSSSTQSTNLMLPSEFTRNRKPGCISNCLDCTVGCEVEFPLDAVACIFDCLTETCAVPQDVLVVLEPGRLPYDNQAAGDDGPAGANGNQGQPPPRYQHVPVPMTVDRNETYLTLAFDVSI